MFKKLQRLLENETDESILWSEFYDALEEHDFLDSEYLSHARTRNFDEAMNNINNMSFEDCCTWLTWILRGERFCAGLFAENIENGNVKALLKRIEELKA